MNTQTQVNGETWYLFTAQYTFQELTYEFHFYARSFEEAPLVLRAITNSATKIEQVMEVIE